MYCSYCNGILNETFKSQAAADFNRVTVNIMLVRILFGNKSTINQEPTHTLRSSEQVPMLFTGFMSSTWPTLVPCPVDWTDDMLIKRPWTGSATLHH